MGFSHSSCLISGADRVRYRSHVNHSVFADVNGLDYRFTFGTFRHGLRSNFDIKLRALQHYLSKYEWVMWVDDDCWFTDFTPGMVERIISESHDRGADIVIAQGAVEPKGFSSFLNSGVILLRQSRHSAALLEGVLREPIDRVEA